MDRFQQKGLVSQRISRKRLGSLKAKFKKFLSDRPSKAESTSSTSFDSEERDEDNTSPGRILEEALLSQSSSSSSDSEDGSSSSSEKKSKSSSNSSSSSEKESKSSSDSSSAKKRKSGAELDESSKPSKGKKKKTGHARKPKLSPDFSGGKKDMDMVSRKKSDSSSDSSSSGKKKKKGKQVEGGNVKKKDKKKKHSYRKKIRKKLNEFLEEEKEKGGDEHELPALEETPPSSPQSASRLSLGVQESEVVGRLPRYHSLPASPANLAHNVNLYYRGGDSSPVSLVHSMSTKEPDILPHPSQGSEISLTSPASSSSVEPDWHGVTQSRQSPSQIRRTQSTPEPNSRFQDAEGVWKCNRCGWTYTTPYPNIRIRREHKQYCEEFAKANQLIDVDKHGAEDIQEGSSGDEEVLKGSILQKNLTAVQEDPMAMSGRDDDHEGDRNELAGNSEVSSSSTHGDAEIGGSSDEHVEGAGSDHRKSEGSTLDKITQNVRESPVGTSNTSSASSDVEHVNEDLDNGRNAAEEHSKESENRQSKFEPQSEEDTLEEAQDQTPPPDEEEEDFRQLKSAAVSERPQEEAEEPFQVDDSESTKDANHGAQIGDEDSILSASGNEAAEVSDNPQEDPDRHQALHTGATESSMEDKNQDSESISSGDDAGRTTLGVAAAAVDDGKPEEEAEEEAEGREPLHVHESESSMEDAKHESTEPKSSSSEGEAGSDPPAVGDQDEKAELNEEVAGGQQDNGSILSAVDTDFELVDAESLEQSAEPEAAVGPLDSPGLGKGGENFESSDYHSGKADGAEDALDKAEASPPKSESIDKEEDSKEVEPHRDAIDTPDEEEIHLVDDGNRVQEDISGDDAGRNVPTVEVTPVVLQSTRGLESEIGAAPDTMTFSSVQKYWADVTKSEYLLIEGKRSPSMRVHEDPGKSSVSPLSLNNAEIGSDQPSSSRGPNAYGENGEITSHPHDGHHEGSTSSNGQQGYDFPQIVREQRTHDLICPVCGSCVTKRIILRKRKRTIVLEGADERPAKRSEEEVVEDDTETWGCLACLSFFIRKIRGEPKPRQEEHVTPVSQVPPGDEEEPDRVECLSLLFPPFNWGPGRADSDLEEPLLQEPEREEVPLIEDQPEIQQDEGRRGIFRYLNFIRKARSLDSTEPGIVSEERVVAEPPHVPSDEDDGVSCLSYLRLVKKPPVDGELADEVKPGTTEEITTPEPGKEIVEEARPRPPDETSIPSSIIVKDTEPQDDAQLYKIVKRVPELFSSLSWGDPFPKYDISPALLKEMKKQKKLSVKPKVTIPVVPDKGKGKIDDNQTAEVEPKGLDTLPEAGTSRDVPVPVDEGRPKISQKVEETMAVEPSDKNLCFCLPLPTITWSMARTTQGEGLSRPLLPEDDARVAVILDPSRKRPTIEARPPDNQLTRKPPSSTGVLDETNEEIISQKIHVEGVVSSEITKAPLHKDKNGTYPDVDHAHVDQADFEFEADVEDGEITHFESGPFKPLKTVLSSGFGNLQLTEEGDEDSKVSDEQVAKVHEEQAARQIMEAVAKAGITPPEDEIVPESESAREPRRPFWWWPSSDPLRQPLLTHPATTPDPGVVVPIPDDTPAVADERCSCMPSLPAFSLYDCFNDDQDVRGGKPIHTTVTVDDGETRYTVQGGEVEDTADATLLAAKDPRVTGEKPSTTGKPYEFLKSIVHGGLDVSLVSLGVVSSGAGGDAKTVTVLAIGLANLFFGVITYFSTVTNLYYTKPKHFEVEVGNRFWLNASLAVVSFLFFGALAPITYGFSFQHTTNRDFKFVAACVVTLVAVVLLGLASAYQKSKSAVKVVSKLIVTGVVAAVVGYEAGNYVSWLLEKAGFDSV